ncbi:MAG: DNA double-strand break repair nuclease NurA [Armatimonadetes bacterium]|nr:DNA double-strand break repair nuclease NurA [Armatimonadota bacterium]
MLKLAALYDEIQRLAAEMGASQRDRTARREAALTSFRAAASAPERLRERAAAAKTSWLIGKPGDEPAAAHDPPAPPAEHTVLACDGSQIFPDPHGPALCYLLNFGAVVLRYGAQSTAELDAVPHLFAREEEVYRGEIGERHAVSAEEVGVVRSVLEIETLLALARAETTRPVVALADGTLIPWGWTRDAGDTWRRDMLARYLAALAGFAELGVPVASYLSRAGGSDVVNLVRLHDCDQEPVNCDQCPHLGALLAETGGRRTMTIAEAGQLPCGGPAGLCDADLFGRHLAEGQRSAVFRTQSKVYDGCRSEAAWFFYLRAGDEVARVELPGNALRPAWVGAVHAVVIDQVRKGRGYPVALREAHEQAVVRAADREAFGHLLERSLVRSGSPVRWSAKQRAKHQPGV